MVAHILIFIYYFVFAWFQQICIKWLLYEVIWLGIHQRHLQISNNLMEKRIINHWLKCKAEGNEMKAPIKVHKYRKEGQIISDWGSIWLDLESREWSWWAMKEGISGHLGTREHHWLRVRLLEECGSLMGKRKEYCAYRDERHGEGRESWKDPTCLGAAKPSSHNYWAHTPVLHSKGSHRNKCSQKPVHCNKM